MQQLCKRKDCVIFSLLEAFKQNLTIEQQIELILKISNKMMNSQASLILIFDKDENNLYYKAVSTNKDELLDLEIPIDKGIAGWTFQNKKAVIVNNVHEDERYYPILEKYLDFPIKNILCVPLFRGSEILGIIEVINKENGSSDFNDIDLENYTTLAYQFSIVLENSLLYEELRREIKLNNLLIEISKEINTSLNAEKILKKVIKIVSSLIKFDASCVSLIYPKENKLHITHVSGYSSKNKTKFQLKFGQGLMGWSAKYAEIVNIKDVSKDPRYYCKRKKTKSELVVPIIKSGKTLGIFNLESNKIAAFSEKDEKILKIIADYSAIAIENALMHREELNHQKIRDEIKIAHNIQQKFLPKQNIIFDNIDISFYYKAAYTVGGDCFDFIKIDDYRTIVFIADVSGKGIPAALVASNLLATIQLLIDSYLDNDFIDLPKIVSSINNLFYKRLEVEYYFTMIIGIIDTKKMTFDYINAGHEYPLIYKYDENYKLLENSNIVVGFLPNYNFSLFSEKLNNGDIILLNTDGLKDSATPHFYPSKVVNIIKDNYHESSDKIIHEIAEAWKISANKSKTKIKDDITMILIKIK